MVTDILVIDGWGSILAVGIAVGGNALLLKSLQKPFFFFLLLPQESVTLLFQSLLGIFCLPASLHLFFVCLLCFFLLPFKFLLVEGWSLRRSLACTTLVGLGLMPVNLDEAVVKNDLRA